MIINHSKKLIALSVFLGLLLFLSYRLFEIPAGLFGDEVLIGVRAFEMLHGDFSHVFNLFTYDHFRYVLGTLPIVTLMPFVAVLGLTEAALRIGVVSLSLLSLYVLYRILYEFKARLPFLAIGIYATTPLFFHFARINFGQIPSLLCVLAGYYFYLRARKNSVNYAIASGIFFGLSGYGLGANIIVTPFFLSLIVFFDLLYNKFAVRKAPWITVVCMVFVISYIPLFHSFATNPIFLHRLQDKNQGTLTFFTSKKLTTIVENYPKYFSYDYLFAKGENDIPGAFISRHAIRGTGVLSKVLLPIIVFGFFHLLVFSAKDKKKYIPFFVLFLLYPFADIITTTRGNAPYSVVLFSTLFCIPFIAAYVINVCVDFCKKKIHIGIFTVLLTTFIALEAFVLIRVYDGYRLYSAGYWGWQSGPREIVSYFKTQSGFYDELYMSGMFNEPQVFLQFYDPESRCNNCFIGGFDRHDPHKKQLFALTEEEFGKLDERVFFEKRIVYYPDNTIAFRIGEYKQ